LNYLFIRTVNVRLPSYDPAVTSFSPHSFKLV
jgi:hypothetical protein